MRATSAATARICPRSATGAGPVAAQREAAILTINAGSSSLKLSLWRRDGRAGLQELWRGEIESIGIAPRLAARTPDGATLIETTFGGDGAGLTHEALLRE